MALASTIPVLGFESVCPRKVGPCPWPRILLSPWPWLWPPTLCPRLHLRHMASKVRNMIKMALKLLLICCKITKITQRLEATPSDPVHSHYIFSDYAPSVTRLSSGMYLGGPLCHSPPPLGCQDCKITLKSKQNWGMAPLCKLGVGYYAKFDHGRVYTKSMFCAFLLGFGPKIGLNLSENLFFALHLILGEKSD